jgi:hypothetical protein
VSAVETAARAQWIGRLSPSAFEDAAHVVRQLGVSAEQAAAALQAFGRAAKALEHEQAVLLAAARAKRPWYRRGRWQG